LAVKNKILQYHVTVQLLIQLAVPPEWYQVLLQAVTGTVEADALVGHVIIAVAHTVNTAVVVNILT
jgi:hypothetical protein